MRLRMVHGVVLAGVVLLAADVASAQRFGRGRRGGPPGPPGGGGFALTPEERERMYDWEAEHQLRHLTEDYELTDEQRETVRARLDEVKAAQRAYVEPRLAELQTLRQEMMDLFRDRRPGEGVDEERFRKIRERFEAIREGSPLFNSDRVAAAVEPLLPAEQVEKGRQRREQRRAEWDQRREEFRRSQGGRDGESDRGPFGGRFGRGDSWDRYVDMFIRRYQLDQSQQVTAQSILRTLKQRRDAYRETHTQDYDAVREIEDREKRGERYRELNAPIDQMYDELRDRLMKLPTSAQIAAEEASRPASRPAAETGSRTDTATSRPADEGVRPPGSGRDRSGSGRDRSGSGRDRSGRARGGQ